MKRVGSKFFDIIREYLMCLRKNISVRPSRKTFQSHIQNARCWVANYFHKKFHLICLTGFWIRLYFFMEWQSYLKKLRYNPYRNLLLRAWWKKDKGKEEKSNKITALIFNSTKFWQHCNSAYYRGTFRTLSII